MEFDTCCLSPERVEALKLRASHVLLDVQLKSNAQDFFLLVFLGSSPELMGVRSQPERLSGMIRWQLAELISVATRKTSLDGGLLARACSLFGLYPEDVSFDKRLDVLCYSSGAFKLFVPERLDC